MAIHLGHRFPGGSSGVPGPSAGRVIGTCFALHRTGFGEPPCHHGSLVGSYPTVSPLPTPERRRSPLCSTFRRLSPPGISPASCPAVSGLSSDARRRPRPSGLHSIVRRPTKRRSARGSTTSGTSRPSASSDRHSGQASTPRRRMTNSPHARHSRLAPRESASSSWSSVRAKDATRAAHRRLRNTPTTLPRIRTWSA